MGQGVEGRGQRPRLEPPGPHSPQASMSLAGDPGMCLLPSECPWLCGEGDIGEGFLEEEKSMFIFENKSGFINQMKYMG